MMDSSWKYGESGYTISTNRILCDPLSQVNSDCLEGVRRIAVVSRTLDAPGALLPS